jgi:LmbE family N-acetylglucosaminyl deacetylase
MATNVRFTVVAVPGAFFYGDRMEAVNVSGRRGVARASSPALLDGVRSLLVVAPHPDDEVIGCGGLLALARRRGCTLSVLYVTCSREERRREAAAAAQRLGVEAVVELGLREGAVKADEDTVALFSSAFRSLAPDLICVPALEDRHPDHRACLEAVARALGQWSTAVARPPVRLATYEGFSPQAAADTWVDITECADEKWQALSCFSSQQHLYRLTEVAQSLNRFRGLVMFRRRVAFAEAFRQFSPELFVRAVRGGVDHEL